MLSKLFDHFNNQIERDHDTVQAKILLAKFAIRDLAGKRAGKYLNKTITDMVSFADGLEHLKKSGEIVLTDDNKQIIFNADNSFTIRE